MSFAGKRLQMVAPDPERLATATLPPGRTLLRDLRAARARPGPHRHLPMSCAELDEQPLYGEPEAAERRRVLAGRADGPPPRPADAGLLPALPRGVPGRPRDRGRRRGVAPAPRPLRLLVGHRSTVDPRPVEVRPP